jgi:hypothetical protein
MLKSKRGIAKTQLTPDIQKVIYIQHKNTTHTRHTKSYISYNTKTQLTPDIQKVIYQYNTKTQLTPDIQKVIYHTTQKHNSHQTYKKLYIIQHHKNK